MLRKMQYDSGPVLKKKKIMKILRIEITQKTNKRNKKSINLSTN